MENKHIRLCNKVCLKTVISLILLCSIVIILSAKGINDENNIVMNGDMPRYLMNGVFFYDAVTSGHFVDVLDYAHLYFAKYPALSLGHHPILLGVAEAPFYAVFGISVFSARLTIIFFMLIGTIAWFLLIKLIYDQSVALFSSLLLITTPFIVEYSRMVMPEIQALSLLIVATYFLCLYCEFDKRWYAYAFAGSILLSIYSKHLVIFMLPVFLIYLLKKKGLKGLVAKEVVISAVVFILLMIPLSIITLHYSQDNVAGVVSRTISDRLSYPTLSYPLKSLWYYHLAHPVFILGFIAILVAVSRRDKRAAIFLYWIIFEFMFSIVVGIHLFPRHIRYTIYWIPAFCLFAATLVIFFQKRSLKITISVILCVVIVYQFVLTFQTKLEYVNGYEKAAEYIATNKKGKCVLYHSVGDTGYFVFFLRKHNHDRDLIILRADKILATSRMNRIVEDKMTKREEIYDVLTELGVGYVVVADIKSESPILELLRKETKSDKFILRKKIILSSSAQRINKATLNIYEYKDYTKPKEDAVINMDIPLMGESISVMLKDLDKI